MKFYCAKYTRPFFILPESYFCPNLVVMNSSTFFKICSYQLKYKWEMILLLMRNLSLVKVKFGKNLMQKQILHWFSPNCKQLIKFSKEVGNIFLLIRAWAMMMLIFPYIMYLLQFLNEFPVLYLSTSPQKSLFRFNSFLFSRFQGKFETGKFWIYFSIFCIFIYPLASYGNR